MINNSATSYISNKYKQIISKFILAYKCLYIFQYINENYKSPTYIIK